MASIGMLRLLALRLSEVKNRLKSKGEELRIRGMIDPKDISQYSQENDEMLYGMIHSKIAVQRSVAVNILAKRHRNDIRFVKAVLERLCKEKSLYMKLEICSALEQGNVESAREIVKYIGRIGNNQHRTLPDRVSRKVSYPLPRDIIARTLSRMSPEIFEVLLEVLAKEDTGTISEVMDAIGYMVFYNNELVTPKHAQYVYNIMAKYGDNQIILWKSVLCLSAFPLESSISILERIKSNYPDTVLFDEASRSLQLIAARNA